MTVTMQRRAASNPVWQALYATPRTPGRATLGPRVGEIAQMMRKPLMPHQQHIADVALEIDPDTGLLAYSRVVVIGPRQVTGKTELLLPVMTHRCIGFEHAGPQRVLYTAQTADDARKKWRDVHLARLGKSKVLRALYTARLTQNKEALFWRNGSMWYPGSTTGKTGGTGDSLDLGIIDEAWSRPDNRTELGMRPTMLTRDWAQLWILSMIPGLSRALPGTWPYLRDQRRMGRARVNAGVRRGTAFFDFAAADGMDPGDPGTWWSCMPGLGYTVTEDKVRDDYVDLPLVDFCAEYLSWEPVETVPKWTLIKEQTWANRLDVESEIAGRPALGVEFSEDREHAWIGAAGRRTDGGLHVEVVEPGFKVRADVVGVTWCEPRLVELVAEQDPSVVVIDPARPARSLIVPLRNRGINVLTPNQGDSAGACGRFFDATGEIREDAVGGEDVYDGPLLFHLGQLELDRALGQARRLELGGGAFTFVKRGQSAELGPLYSVVLALHGDEVFGEDDYDLADSVDAGGRCSCGRAIYQLNGSWWHAMDDSPAC